MEIIRFGLLVTMTVALLTLAARGFDGNDHDRTTGAAGRPSTSPGGASPSATAPSTQPSPTQPAPSGSTSPSGPPSATPSTGGPAGTGTGTGGTGNGGTGGTGPTSGTGTLAVTGAADTVRLLAVACALIAGGSLGLAGTRRSITG